jgi:hypothetical protein
LFFMIRGSGELQVSYKLDLDSSQEVFGILIGKQVAVPRIDNHDAFVFATRQQGQRVGSRKASLVSQLTTFSLPPGTWQIALYGIFERAGDKVILPDTAVKTITVHRNKSQTAVFNFATSMAEIRFTLQGDNKRGVKVWIDDNVDRAVFTNGDGRADLQCAIGTHQLRIDYHGEPYCQPLQIVSPRIERVTFNVDRERKLANIGGVDGQFLSARCGQQCQHRRCDVSNHQRPIADGSISGAL